MSQLIKKENISVVVGQYPDPQNPQNMKNRHRTIGELVTMQGDDGSVYQFGELWGPHGSTKFKVYDQDSQGQQPAPQQGYAQPQQGYAHQQPPAQAAPQQGYAQPPQGANYGGHRG